MGLLLLLIPTLAVPRVFRTLSHKLELRADSVARANEPDPGVYARPLERLYEDGLLPAVNAQKQATYPHLYDRLVAASKIMITIKITGGRGGRPPSLASQDKTERRDPPSLGQRRAGRACLGVSWSFP